MREASRPEPPGSRTDEVDVVVEVNRCPYCHDGVEAGEAVVCAGCLARHHPPCAGEAGECGACRAREFLQRRPAFRDAGPVAMSIVALLGGALTGTCGPVSSNDALYLTLPLVGCFLAGYLHPRPPTAFIAPVLFVLAFFVTVAAWVASGWTGYHGLHAVNAAVLFLLEGAVAALVGLAVARRRSSPRAPRAEGQAARKG